MSIILATSLYAQDEVLDNFTSGNVYNLKKDTKGRIWMATEKGLYVSDGINYIQIKTGDREITNSAIRQLILNKNSLFLIYKNKGLIKLDINTLQYKNITDKAVANLIIENDTEFHILFLNGGLYHVTSNRQKYKFDLINQFTSDLDNPPSMTNFSKNSLIVSVVSKGIYLINKLNGRIEKSYNIKPYNDHKFVYLDNNIFFLNKNVLYDLNTKNIFLKSNYVKENSNITSIIQISDTEKIIIKYKKNIFLEKNGNTIQLNLTKEKNYIIHDAIYGYKSNILFATNQGIVSILNIKKKVNSLFDSVIQMKDYINVRGKILPYKNNKIILMGIPLSHIYDFSNNKFTPLTKKYFSAHDAILKGDILYATSVNGGIKKINIYSKKLSSIITKNIDTIKLFDAVCDIEKVMNNHIIFGRKGAVVLYNYTNNTSREINLNNNARINTIKVDSVSRLIYIATNEGIYVLDLSNKKISKKTKIPGKLISDLVIMHTKNTTLLWYISNMGLTGINLLNNTVEIQLDLLNFNNYRLSTLSSDRKGRIWVSTDGGLFAYEYPINSIIKLDARNGIINNEFNFNSAAVLDNGDLIFGGLNGYDIVHVNSFNFNGKSIKGDIMGYSIYSSNNRIYENFIPNQTISYNKANNYIQFYFSLKEFEKFKYSEFEYKIDDNNWVPLNGLSSFYLYKLQDGVHTINLRGYDESGNPIIFDQINVKYYTSFFQSQLFIFILLFFIIFLLTLAFFINYFHYTKINRIKNNIAMDLHDEIGTILNRTLFTLRNNSNNDYKNIVIEYLTEAMYSVRTYIRAFSDEIISSHNLIDELKELVKNYSKNDEIKYTLTYNFDKEYSLKSNEYRDLKLTIYEIYQNILKHSEAINIQTNININNYLLTVIIIDDGCLKIIQDIENKGNGILNIKKRIKRLNGKVLFSINPIGNGLIINLNFKLN